VEKIKHSIRSLKMEEAKEEEKTKGKSGRYVVNLDELPNGNRRPIETCRLKQRENGDIGLQVQK
jgi:hypothetical protein